jgi:hypothetical protein
VTERAALRALRRFTRDAGDTSLGRCELCMRTLAAEHAHRLLADKRVLECLCDRCAFETPHEAPWKVVAHKVERLPGFQMTATEWEALGLPVRLAFFVRRSDGAGVQAFFPSAAGATEAPLDKEQWAELSSKSPLLVDIEPDVDALLVHHAGGRELALLVSVDVCYELIGTLRVHWRGFAGGDEAWQALDAFMAKLTRTTPREPHTQAVAHA